MSVGQILPVIPSMEKKTLYEHEKTLGEPSKENVDIIEKTEFEKNFVKK